MTTVAMRTPSPAPAEGDQEQQRCALWYASQGCPLDSIAAELDVTPAAVKNLLNAVMHRLGARNLVHAVALGLLNGEIGKYVDCGTHLAYLRHVGRDEVVDPLCKAAHYRHVMGQSRYEGVVKLTPTQIKVLRALYLGAATLQEAADQVGLSRDRIGHHVSAAYRKLGVTHYPYAQRRDIALRRAEQMGLFK